MRVIAVIDDPCVTEKIIRHLGLARPASQQAPAGHCMAPTPASPARTEIQ